MVFCSPRRSNSAAMTALVRPGFNTSLPGASIIARARPLFWAPRACGTSYAGLRFLGKIFNYFHVFPTWRSQILTVLSGKCLKLLFFGSVVVLPLFRSLGARVHSRHVLCSAPARSPTLPAHFPHPVSDFSRMLSGFTGSCPGPIRVRSGPVQTRENR